MRNEPIKTRRSAAERRHSLLQAALDLFSTQGYNGTTTRAIALRVGVTEALLFRHFRSKEELLRAVVATFGPPQLFAPPSPTLRDAPVREALDHLVTQYLDAFWTHRAFLRMAFSTPKCDQAVFADLWAEFGGQALTLYTLLAERSGRGELRAGVAEIATDVISAATGGFLARVLADEPTDWNAARAQFVARLLDVALNGILAKI